MPQRHAARTLPAEPRKTEASISRTDRAIAGALLVGACLLAAACTPPREQAAEAVAGESGEAGALAPLVSLPVAESLATDPVALARPPAAETRLITPRPGSLYEIDAAAEDATLEFDGKDLALRFPDDGRLLFQGLLALAEQGEAPRLRVGSVELDGDMMLGQAMLQTDDYPPLVTGSLASETALEPAAGDGALAPPWRLFFATDREREGFDPSDYRYTARGAPEGLLSFGQLLVALPGSAADGTLVASMDGWSGIPLATDEETEAALIEIEPLWRSAFQDRLRAATAEEVLLFAHGPGLSFEQAAARLARIAAARRFEGTLVLYSWPAEGGDSGNALIGRNLKAVLRTLRSQTAPARLHLLANAALAGAIGPRLGEPTGTGEGSGTLYWDLGRYTKPR